MVIKNKTILILPVIFLTFFIFSTDVLLAATALDNAQTQLNATAAAGYGSGGYVTDVPSALGKFVGAGLAFIGIIFFGLMIYGGFIWMLARGNEQEVTKAKNLIVSAIIGLLIVLSAYAFTYYIGGILTTT